MIAYTVYCNYNDSKNTKSKKRVVLLLCRHVVVSSAAVVSSLIIVKGNNEMMAIMKHQRGQKGKALIEFTVCLILRIIFYYKICINTNVSFKLLSIV